MTDGLFLGTNQEGKMKKAYETPQVLLTLEREDDIITTSGGDMPLVDAFDW